MQRIPFLIFLGEVRRDVPILEGSDLLLFPFLNRFVTKTYPSLHPPGLAFAVVVVYGCVIVRCLQIYGPLACETMRTKDQQQQRQKTKSLQAKGLLKAQAAQRLCAPFGCLFDWVGTGTATEGDSLAFSRWDWTGGVIFGLFFIVKLSFMFVLIFKCLKTFLKNFKM